MSTKSKSTPGPWFADDDLAVRVHDQSTSAQMGDYKGCLIADLAGALGCSNPADPECLAAAKRARAHALPETEANMRLIAACPTMYDYIARKAKEGDADAAAIIAAIRAD